MNIIIIILAIAIIILIYCLYDFYKEIEDYKVFTTDLNDIIAKKNRLLKHIESRAIRNAGYQYNGNSAIGFREIAELASQKRLDIYDGQSKISSSFMKNI